MQELLLMNPEPHDKGKGARSFQIVFPKNIKKLRANPDTDTKKSRGDKELPLLGITAKQAAAGAAGASTTVALPRLAKLEGWGDVAASGVITVVGSAAVGSMDKEAGKAFAIGSGAVTITKGLVQLIKTAKGQKKKTKKTARKGKRSLGDEDIDRLLGNVEDLSDEELDAILSAEDDDLLGVTDDDLLGADDDLLGALDAGIEDMGQIIVES